MEDVELEHAYFAVALKGRHPDGERPALQLWAEGYLRAAAPCLERIRVLRVTPRPQRRSARTTCCHCL